MKPLVSIITPTTKARAAFMPRLLEMVAAQDYPNVEHIIIDDESLRIGAKRNLGCGRANGDIILHFDSDDCYAPDWVSRSVAALGDADITGLASLYFHQPQTGDTWLYAYGTDESRPFVAGATMCYRKAFWERNNFHDRQVGEDNKFLWSAPAIVRPHNYINGFLSILHADNTSPKNLNNYRWKKVTGENLTEVPLNLQWPSSGVLASR